MQGDPGLRVVGHRELLGRTGGLSRVSTTL
jgi:hypothetical protein